MVVSVETQRYFPPPSLFAESNDFLGSFRLVGRHGDDNVFCYLDGLGKVTQPVVQSND